MNTGQTMLTIGAMILLSLVLLRVNNNNLSTGTVMMENKFGVLALSLATSYIEEATGKAFDAATVDQPATALTVLEGASSLGHAPTEVYPNFNDFDDYNGLSILDTTMRSAQYKIECDVYYVDPSDPDKKSTSRTWHKRIDVEVSSKSMQDTIKLSTVYSYFYFR